MKFGSPLSTDLREKHGRRTVRPRVGDTVKIVKGEFKGVEGKVTKVNPSLGVVNVEGVNRERLKGGNAPVPIRSANVLLTALTLADKMRKKKLEGES